MHTSLNQTFSFWWQPQILLLRKHFPFSHQITLTPPHLGILGDKVSPKFSVLTCPVRQQKSTGLSIPEHFQNHLEQQQELFSGNVVHFVDATLFCFSVCNGKMLEKNRKWHVVCVCRSRSVLSTGNFLLYFSERRLEKKSTICEVFASWPLSHDHLWQRTADKRRIS